jgi:hypothetical protein
MRAIFIDGPWKGKYLEDSDGKDIVFRDVSTPALSCCEKKYHCLRSGFLDMAFYSLKHVYALEELLITITAMLSDKLFDGKLENDVNLLSMISEDNGFTYGIPKGTPVKQFETMFKSLKKHNGNCEKTNSSCFGDIISPSKYFTGEFNEELFLSDWGIKRQ